MLEEQILKIEPNTPNNRRYTLEVNHHSGSFWIMINPDYKENGGS